MCRMESNRWNNKVVEWLLIERARRRGRQKTRWPDIFRQRVRADWMSTARDRKQWVLSIRGGLGLN